MVASAVFFIRQNTNRSQQIAACKRTFKGLPISEFLFFVSESVSGSVKFWYVTKTVPPFWPNWSHDNVHPHLITALAFVPDSEDIVVGSYGSEVS